MLKSLYVRNFALIDEVQLDLAAGLNILTGETGAGKSILIGALGLIIGERASTDLVRQGADKAIVEGVFDVRDNEYVRAVLAREGYDCNDELIVRREVTVRGTSRAFVNDSPASLALLKDLGDHLVDLHGQHEHQMLLRAETHVAFLDAAAGLEEKVKRYAGAHAGVVESFEALRELRMRETQLRERQEFHRFQLGEIDAVAPRDGEDVEIQNELKILENAERIVGLITELSNILSEGENNVYDRLNEAQGCLDQLAGFDQTFNEYSEECGSALVSINEIAKQLGHYADRIEFSPSRVEELRTRLYALSGLRKKFGGTLAAVLEYRAKIVEELDLAGNFDERIAAIESELQERRTAAGKLAAELSKLRTAAARTIESSVETMLRTLGIDKARFVIGMRRRESDAGSAAAVLVERKYVVSAPTGIDVIEFMISTNVGEEPKPLAKVASGGEISRVMLALKSILAQGSRLPMLVFDEIDTGISGRIASKVGAAMQRLGERHQIIAITHLPQIAATSHQHFVVEKGERDGRTLTTVRALDADEHTREVAKLMSGEKITESSLRMARELIGG
ncbi:MAG TPA: DNA repair protein RecN [Candidatus Kapabacteria bacterium]|nr:DNA repair protein RecN [Candidatus Kapabacteria bacterium]